MPAKKASKRTAAAKAAMKARTGASATTAPAPKVATATKAGKAVRVKATRPKSTKPKGTKAKGTKVTKATKAAKATAAKATAAKATAAKATESNLATQRPTGAYKARRGQSPGKDAPQRILAIDVGGTRIKMLLKGEHEPVKAASGKRFTAADLVEAVRTSARGWRFDAVSIGYPGLVGEKGPVSEPGNLGAGWLGFDFAGAFGVPVKVMNDAAMQALGSYEGGRMLFLSLGTGLGSTLIADNVIVPLELGQLPYQNGKRIGLLVGRRGLQSLGKAKWREVVTDMVASLQGAFNADYVVVGGGNAKTLKELPPGVRLGNNLAAFRGGFRMWHLEEVAPLPTDEHAAHKAKAKPPADWRVI
jgi:hypothetical protein